RPHPGEPGTRAGPARAGAGAGDAEAAGARLERPSPQRRLRPQAEHRRHHSDQGPGNGLAAGRTRGFRTRETATTATRAAAGSVSAVGRGQPGVVPEPATAAEASSANTPCGGTARRTRSRGAVHRRVPEPVGELPARLQGRFREPSGGPLLRTDEK